MGRTFHLSRASEAGNCETKFLSTASKCKDPTHRTLREGALCISLSGFIAYNRDILYILCCPRRAVDDI